MISVLTLTYKRPHLLEEAIESFLRQNINTNESVYVPAEMVIINDNPDVEYVFDHPLVRIINHKERFPSISAKLEWGYKQCKYPWIYRLDDDDLLAEGGLDRVVKDILTHDGFEIYRSHGMYFFVNNTYERINSNINNGNVYSKSFLDRITFPDKSIGEDSDITFGNNASIYESKTDPTMCYRWGMNTFHISGLGEQSSDVILAHADMVLSNKTGVIELHPQFLSNYYEQIKAGIVDRLTRIANKLGTDKGTLESVWGHGYTLTYNRLFDVLNTGHVRMLEIGVADPRFPGASPKMWAEYFDDLYFVGYDINPDAKAFQGGKVHIFIGDQNNPEDLEKCIEVYGGQWDIIMDDGSHWEEHILTSFRNLFPYVKPGGYYIIEDLHSAFTHAQTMLPRLDEIIKENHWELTKTSEHGGKLLILKKAL